MDDATVIAKVKSELSWLQKHERMILVILGGLVLWFAIGKIDQVIINHDAANLSQAKVTADAQAKANAWDMPAASGVIPHALNHSVRSCSR